MSKIHHKYCSEFVSNLCILDMINARKKEHVKMTITSWG